MAGGKTSHIGTGLTPRCDFNRTHRRCIDHNAKYTGQLRDPPGAKAIVQTKVFQPQIAQVLDALKPEQIARARPHIGNERNAAGGKQRQHMTDLIGIRRSPILGNMQRGERIARTRRGTVFNRPLNILQRAGKINRNTRFHASTLL